MLYKNRLTDIESAFNIVIKSVIGGSTPVEIYVASKDNPKTALVWGMMGKLLVKGETNNLKRLKITIELYTRRINYGN